MPDRDGLGGSNYQTAAQTVKLHFAAESDFAQLNADRIILT